ncbi:MAG: SpoIIE family protein phosphatase [Actinomycetes bacterium]
MCAHVPLKQGEAVTSSIMADVTARASATFPPVDLSVGRARRFVRATLSAWGADALADDAVLLTSEFVTNAIIHAGTDAEVVCTLLPDAVQIDVVDRYPTRVLPAPPSAVDENSEGGRGLQLASELAAVWGIEYAATTKRVWFRVLLPEAVLGALDADAAAALAAEPDVVLRVATVRLSLDGTVRDWDAAATELFGWSAAEAVGRPMAGLVGDVRPPDDAWVTTARWEGAYDVRHRDGNAITVHARHVRIGGDDGSVLCLLVDHRLRALLTEVAPTSPVRPVSGRGDSMAPSSAQLVRLGLDELLARTVESARDTLGGDAAFALVATDAERELELRCTTGFSAAPPRFSRMPVEEGIAGRISSDLMPVVYDDLAAAGPAGLGWLRDADVRSLVTAPLLTEGRLIGTIGVTSVRPGRFTNEHGARLQQTADEVALPVQTARLTELERRRRGWLSYLAEASDLLAGTLELDMTLALVAQLVVPRLAPWCGIYLRDETGTSRPAYVWHADEDRIEDLRVLLDKVPAPEPTAEPGARRWLPAEDLLPGGLDQMADLAAVGASVVPLVARGRAIGALAMGDPVGQAVPPELLELATDLARRAALALDNARLYEERTATSRALQRSLLPPELPDLPAVEVGVVYEAAGSGNEVGGDFYDVFPLADGRFAFAVGDVCGKGPEAAAVTGLARHALRLLARRGDGLSAALGHLNAAILDETSGTRFLTVVYGEGESLREGGLRLRLASAGHPSPLLLTAEGTVSSVGTAGDLLGVFPEPSTSVCEVELAPGQSLVCFTDGVTERRDGTRMLGEDGVAATLAATAGLPASAVARRLRTVVTDYAAEPPRDDLAILVLRAR